MPAAQGMLCSLPGSNHGSLTFSAAFASKFGSSSWCSRSRYPSRFILSIIQSVTTMMSQPVDWPAASGSRIVPKNSSLSLMTTSYRMSMPNSDSNPLTVGLPVGPLSMYRGQFAITSSPAGSAGSGWSLSPSSRRWASTPHAASRAMAPRYIDPRPARRSSSRLLTAAPPNSSSRSVTVGSSLSSRYDERVLRMPRQPDRLPGRREPVHGRPQVLGVHGHGVAVPGRDGVHVADADERGVSNRPLDRVV